jgi:hypothetical protein
MVALEILTIAPMSDEPDRQMIGQRVAPALQGNRSSTYVSQLIEWQTRASAQAQPAEKSRPMTIHQEWKSTTTRQDGESDVLEPQIMLEIERFLPGKRAYCSCKKKLLDAVHESYEEPRSGKQVRR